MLRLQANMPVAILALFGRRAGRELYRTPSERRASNIHRSGALILHNPQNLLLREIAACGVDPVRPDTRRIGI